MPILLFCITDMHFTVPYKLFSECELKTTIIYKHHQNYLSLCQDEYKQILSQIIYKLEFPTYSIKNNKYNELISKSLVCISAHYDTTQVELKFHGY